MLPQDFTQKRFYVCLIKTISWMTYNGLRHILASLRARKLGITNDSNTHQTSECEDDSINNEDEGPNVIVIKAH